MTDTQLDWKAHTEGAATQLQKVFKESIRRMLISKLCTEPGPGPSMGGVASTLVHCASAARAMWS